MEQIQQMEEQMSSIITPIIAIATALLVQCFKDYVPKKWRPVFALIVGVACGGVYGVFNAVPVGTWILQGLASGCLSITGYDVITNFTKK